MKTLHTVTDPTQYPSFWNEEWLKKAIEELDTRRMTAEERAYFARVTAANAEAVKAEKQRMQNLKAEMIGQMLLSGKLSIEDIASFSFTSNDFVLEVQQKLNQNNKK